MSRISSLGFVVVIAWAFATSVVAQEPPTTEGEESVEGSEDSEPDSNQDSSPDAPVEDAGGDTMIDEELRALEDEMLGEDDASPDEPSESDDPAVLPALREVTVRYRPEDVFRMGGSVQVIDKEQLETFEYDDPNSVVLQVPGVYVRQEDGYGLRPNIGLRGVSSDRSSKVTLMEDGVLFGPAPYAAPAAYYFPIVTRMTGVEVFKGPSSILYGPNTIGGAINFLTREVPEEPSGQVDVAYGRFQYRKSHIHYGARNRWGGFLFEGIHLGTQGFKDLDFGDPDTGFRRTEFMLKGYVNTDPEARVYNKLELKLGYSRERSNETYLGLTDADFGATPYRRYAASQLDRMTWWRAQVAITHELAVGDHFSAETTAYRHDFERTWRRLNGFRGTFNETTGVRDATPLLNILASPSGERLRLFQILSGQADSASVEGGSDTEDLLVVSNARDFVSTGIQTKLRGDFETGPLRHEIEGGIRFHYDEVDRFHTNRAYRMQNQQLVFDGIDPADDPTLIDRDNLGQAYALAAYLVYGLQFKGLTVSPGLRAEWIRTKFDDDTPIPFDASPQEDTQFVLLPGIGVQYAITDELGVLAGVHRGFSPVAPGNSTNADPELSINYELGGRYLSETENAHAEVIGFVNDYSNLLGTCTGSSGCTPAMIDDQANGGEVLVVGVELSGGYTLELGRGLKMPMRGAYTFTRARFQTSFQSDFPIFGEVEDGDDVPYVPRHQAQVQLGLEKAIWSFRLSGTYVGSMDEGDAGAIDLPRTDDYFVLDAVGSVRLFDRLDIYLRLENVTNTQAIVARRPFGARPNRPFQVQAGIKADL